MENIQEFLDTSSINGMNLILRTRNFSRLFWILIVIGGFSGAIYMINESFENWAKNPISTSTKILPKGNITFANVTVCPPRNIFLNLNIDIQKSVNITLEEEVRDELIDFAFNVIQDEFYDDFMANLSKIQDPDRYYNWYHGYTQLKMPAMNDKGELNHWLLSYATSGNISTQYFGDKFDAEKVDSKVLFAVLLYAPPSAMYDSSTTLMLKIEKITMPEAHDRMSAGSMSGKSLKIHDDLKPWSKNITPPGFMFDIQYERDVSEDDINQMNLDMMPGFRLTWSYNKQHKPRAFFTKKRDDWKGHRELEFIR